MPPLGFKTITVSESEFERIQAYFLKHKAELAIRGIFNIQEFVTDTLNQQLKEREKARRFAGLITQIPQVIKVYL